VFNTVLVPLDGSELAERALPYAVRLAADRGGRLVLLRAALARPPSGLDWERQQLAVMEEATAYLAGVAEKVATRVPVATAPLYGHAANARFAQLRARWPELNDELPSAGMKRCHGHSVDAAAAKYDSLYAGVHVMRVDQVATLAIQV